MKVVNINLEIASISVNRQPQNVIPCPRVNIFKHPIIPNNITKPGSYNFIFNLEDDGRCGIDVFGWLDNEINIISDLPLVPVQKFAGEKKDQIQKTINIKNAGTYNIMVTII